MLTLGRATIFAALLLGMIGLASDGHNPAKHKPQQFAVVCGTELCLSL